MSELSRAEEQWYDEDLYFADHSMPEEDAKRMDRDMYGTYLDTLYCEYIEKIEYHNITVKESKKEAFKKCLNRLYREYQKELGFKDVSDYIF